MEEVSKYVSDLIEGTTVEPRVGGGVQQKGPAVIQDKEVGVNIRTGAGNIDISKKKENIKSPFGTEKIDSTTLNYDKRFDSGVGVSAGVTKRVPNQGKNEIDKRLTLSLKKDFNKGGAVEIGKGKDYIKDLL